MIRSYDKKELTQSYKAAAIAVVVCVILKGFVMLLCK